MKLKENQEVFVFNKCEPDLHGFGKVLEDTEVSYEDDIVLLRINFSGETQEMFENIYELAPNRTCKNCGHILLKNKCNSNEHPFVPYLCPVCETEKSEEQSETVTEREYSNMLEKSKKRFLEKGVRDIIASYIPGAETLAIEKYANAVMSISSSDKLIEEIEKIDFTWLMAGHYRPGRKVLLVPFDEEDYQREVTIITFDNEDNILVTDDDGIEQEVVLGELFLRSTKVCPKCGNTIYHEKYSNTEDRYPYVCFGCNENFFEFEINPLLK